MDTHCTCAAGVLAAALIVVLPGAGFSQTTQPRGEIRVPDNLPAPVDADMRVAADDIDTTLRDDNVILLDVREPWELEEYGTREGYINIPLGELEGRLDELPKDKLILTA